MWARRFAIQATSLCAAAAAAQGVIERVPGMSKQLSLAIEHYENGEDLQAMDRFMEVLTEGDPSERPVANEYMNLITQRMALGQDGVRAAAQPPLSKEPMRFERGPGGLANPAVPDRGALLTPPSPDSLRPREVELTRSDREVMRHQIENKLQSRASLAISRLRKYEDIRIIMANARLPRAIGLPASLLFESGVLFKKGSADVLEILSDLAFSLGATQLLLLPERAMLGDSKILDMRRSMAISSHLFKAGIAPSRVRVNLLSNQVDIPREVADFPGILVAFVYNQPLSLRTDSSIDAEAGPPISIGVSPGTVDPRTEEGSVIEFSVIEPPAGLMSWGFQLSGPGKSKDGEMTVLQEVKGVSPVFHQIFWNGRRSYFGERLPAGRYQCLLTATDMKGRTRKKLQWITVEGPASPPKLAAAAPTAKRRSKAPPPAELEGEETDRPGPRRVTIGRRRARGASRRAARRAGPRAVPIVARKEAPPKDPGQAEPEASAAPAPAPQPAPAPAPAPEAMASNWAVFFAKDTLNIVQDGEGQIGKAADTMSYYPLDSLQLTGFANRGESDAQGLAGRRADAVADMLVKRYKLDPKRIRKQQRVVENEYYKVEIYVLPGK